MKKSKIIVLVVILFIGIGIGTTIYLKSNNTYNISIQDSVNKTIGNNIKVRLPKINVNTTTVNSLNAKILDEELERTKEYEKCQNEMPESCLVNGMTYDYNYLVKDNILIIYIFVKLNSGSEWPGTGGYYNNYFYDIKEDKVLTDAEVFNRLKISKIENASDFGQSEINDLCYRFEIDNNDLKVYYSPFCHNS